jgi:hypothetical protein
MKSILHLPWTCFTQLLCGLFGHWTTLLSFQLSSHVLFDHSGHHIGRSVGRTVGQLIRSSMHVAAPLPSFQLCPQHIMLPAFTTDIKKVY